MNVTYSDLFQLLILIVALVSLCYQIFKEKKSDVIIQEKQIFLKDVCFTAFIVTVR